MDCSVRRCSCGSDVVYGKNGGFRKWLFGSSFADEQEFSIGTCLQVCMGVFFG